MGKAGLNTLRGAWCGPRGTVMGRGLLHPQLVITGAAVGRCITSCLAKSWLLLHLRIVGVY